ncbi:MAG: F0F1 ATP synthase subunit A [Lachnospiraceae bacterium]|nr:F0F1 ATP synthase subunit A [Lachnospiraceae bacterium]
MGDIAARLQEELEIKTAFTIPIFGGIAVNQSVVVTWCIMALLLIVTLIMTSGMKVRNPGRKQIMVESFVVWIQNLTGDMLGEEAKEYVPYISTILIYLGISNTIGIFNIAPPTKDLRVTVALALMSIVVVESASFKRKGGKKFLKSFGEPMAVIAPMNILELGIKPLSLCMRLFGNIFAAFVIMELVKMAVPVILPAALCLYFDLFDGLIQAYVFVFLTSLYIKEAIE